MSSNFIPSIGIQSPQDASKLQIINNVLKNIANNGNDLQSQINIIDGEIIAINSEIGTINSEINVIDNNISTINSEIININSEISIIQNELLPPQIETDSNLTMGQPIYLKNNGHLDLAKSISPYQKCIGLSDNNYSSGLIAGVLNNKLLTMTNWTNVTGSTNLILGDYYFLDPNISGMITNIVPSIGYCFYIGEALSTTSLQIELDQPILL